MRRIQPPSLLCLMLTMKRVLSAFFGRNGRYEAQSGGPFSLFYVPFLTVLTLIPAPFMPETGLKPVGRSYSRSHRMRLVVTLTLNLREEQPVTLRHILPTIGWPEGRAVCATCP